jgi:hypothetical protein
MGDDGGSVPVPAAANSGIGGGHAAQDGLAIDTKQAPRTSTTTVHDEDIKSPAMPPTPNPFMSRQASLEIDDYFVRRRHSEHDQHQC